MRHSFTKGRINKTLLDNSISISFLFTNFIFFNNFCLFLPFLPFQSKQRKKAASMANTTAVPCKANTTACPTRVPQYPRRDNLPKGLQHVLKLLLIH